MKKIILIKPDNSIAISHFQHEFDTEKERELIIQSVGSFIMNFYDKELGLKIDDLICKSNNLDLFFKDEINAITKEVEILDAENNPTGKFEIKADLDAQKEWKANKYKELIDEAEKLLLPDIYEVVDSLEIEEDKYFRNAWIFDNGKIKICPNKKLNVIREKRNRLLAELDKEELAESFKPNGNVEAVRAKKQVLRDLPSANLTDEEIKEILN